MDIALQPAPGACRTARPCGWYFAPIASLAAFLGRNYENRQLRHGAVIRNQRGVKLPVLDFDIVKVCAHVRLQAAVAAQHPLSKRGAEPLSQKLQNLARCRIARHRYLYP